jgi:hypothetical protein
LTITVNVPSVVSASAGTGSATTVTHVMSPAKAAAERKSVRSTTTSSDLAPVPEGYG